MFYQTASGGSPVKEFLDRLPVKHQKKVAATLELLKVEGPALRRPYGDHVRGKLRELRVLFGGNQARVFHFFMLGSVAVLVHAFAKKTQKLPEREILTAELRMKDFIGRLKRGEIVL